MQLSAFKAQCSATVREVQRSRQPLLITLRGEPMAVVAPLATPRRLGALRGEAVLRSDLLNTDFGDDWQTNR